MPLTDDADSALDNSAGLGELMHATFRGLRGRWMQQLAPFGLTPHQFRALNGVGRSADASGPGVRLKDLAEWLRIAPRSATEVVDQLQEKGLVERTPDPNDRRATRISLSEAGQELRTRIRSARRREADEYFSVLSAEDRTQLARILGQLATDGRRGIQG
ncbi:MarR family transcriptional regulator [Arthrobacter sp. zg-Y1219]|uniref:MarR family winged helix-turn-helix transcriptional regulator n=1 Tax=Arthrobacter sp. zg-Y1219 TaxID=3049067 RepID=UPI0024C26F81|nr:MarR family transcriptional regulator [Arthrobacter sp. zg-Y1219]MDK1361973.1 MarR family transcriptional regulator [Arthrobacter sp. zg-Y1219]